MILAWRNMLHDRGRFAVTIAGFAFSVFLMLFQGSLLAGFMRASSRIVDASDAELWVAARGVDCFECATPIPARLGDVALGVDGIRSYDRIAVGQAIWKKPSGKGQVVFVIGGEPGVGG